MAEQAYQNERAVRFFQQMKGKSVAFCGIGVSNLPLIRQFAQLGAVVTACDKRSRQQLGATADELEEMGVALKLGEGYLEDLNQEVIFRSPGMRFTLPQLERARANGAAVTSELEVFFALCPCPIYAVTGSDGKTTTTAIIAQLLQEAGKTVHLGGNIGRPLLPEINAVAPGHAAVAELSSFQLISMRQSPHVAVVTNLSPNHLDVHKDMQEYIQAKKNILLHQDAFSKTVLNQDNDITRGFAGDVRGELRFFSRRGQCENGAWADGDAVYLARHGRQEAVLPVGEIHIPGWHNVENYLAAFSAVCDEVSVEQMRRVARTFAGVEHRAEFVREVNGVRYYNDSIASSPTRTIRGTLSLYPQRIVLIAGGYDKKIPYEPLGPVIADKVKTLILMGDTAPKIEQAVRAAENYDPQALSILHVDNMEQAVRAAQANSQAGDIVSLSPASASFDKYPNFEARGRHFKELVMRL